MSSYRYQAPERHQQARRPQGYHPQSRVRTAYRKTREDVQAHKHLHDGVDRSQHRQPHSSRIESGKAGRSRPAARSSQGRRRLNAPAGSGGRHGVSPARRRRVSPKLLVSCAALIVVVVAVLWFHPFGIGAPAPQQQEQDPAAMTTDGSQAHVWFPTPYIAESNGVKLHCAVSAQDLTEILIHNASYSYAEPLTTELKEATNVEVKDAHGTGRVAVDQPTGDAWLTGEFIRTYREGNGGPKMSAIDCGAAPGSQVYSPVTGTVTLVRAYKLYNNEDYDDFEIHIQPDGHPELDVVLIHLTNPCVERGMAVEGGVTPIAKIRDVYAYIGESMQLKKYTAEGDNGNHTHIQVNDATNKEYHGLDEERIAKSVPLSNG